MGSRTTSTTLRRRLAALGAAGALAVSLVVSTAGYLALSGGPAQALTANDIYTVAGNGTGGYTSDGVAATSSELNGPSNVAFDSSGDLFIADDTNERVRMVAAATCASSCPFGLASTTANDIYTVAGDGGTGGYTGDGTVATSTELNTPTGVAVDSSGDLLIVDRYNQRVRMVAATTCASSCPYGLASTTEGFIYTVAGNGTAGYTGDAMAATSAEVSGPYGAAVDSSGNILIADASNQRIRMVAATTCASSCPYGLASTTEGFIYTVAGGGGSGTTDGVSATSATLAFPEGVGVDSSGDLLVVDYNHALIRIVAAATCASSCPYGLASTTADDIYTVAGNGTGGYTGDGGLATSAEVNGPYGMAADSSGNLLIADASNYRIRMVAASTCSSGCPYGLASTTEGYIYTVAGNGTAGYSGDGVAATSSELNFPTGVAIDSSGVLFIADQSNARIREVAKFGLPTVTSLSSTSGSTSGSTTVTVTGTGFTGATAVDFGATPGTGLVVNSATSITITSPAESAGSVDVTVNTPGGTSTISIGDKFTYYAPSPSPIGTSTSLIASTSSPAPGATLTFTATVSSGGSTPSGTVSFFSGGSAIAGCVDLPLNGGTVSCTASFAAAGTDSITASFNGTSLYLASTSSALTLDVGTSTPTTTTPPTTVPPTTVPPTTVPPTTVPPTTVPPTCPAGDTGTPPNCKPAAAYIVTTAKGTVDTFGSANNDGSVPSNGDQTTGPIVGSALTANNGGYWLVSSHGGVYAFGNAGFFGAADTTPLKAPIVGISGTSDAKGYWLVASDGGVFSFGDARFFGSAANVHLAAQVVGFAPSADAMGYLLVASDGGVFSFGDAIFKGSVTQMASAPAGATATRSAIVGIATSPGGYWVVDSKGDVYAFGSAGTLGDCTQIGSGCQKLDASIVSIQATPNGGGYWLIGADGGVFSFGNAPFDGSASGHTGGSSAV